MINTVIVDDEIWVCQLIKNILDWESYGFTIIGEAYNGNDAVELISNKKPDLVLTDIRMPGIDGIGIIETIRQQGLGTKFVIISGYNDFEYAQRAIKLGALGYLLKPIDKNELSEFLIMINRNVLNDKESEMQKVELNENLVSSLIQLKQQYFSNYFSNNMNINEINIHSMNKDLRCNFHEGLFKTVVYKFDQKSIYSITAETEDLIYHRTYQYVMDIFPAICYECVITFLNNSAVLILNYNENNRNNINKATVELFKKLKDNNIKISDFDLTAGIGSEENNINRLKRSYDKSMDGIIARIKFGLNRIIDILQYKLVEYSVSQAFSVEQEKKLSRYLEVFDCYSAKVLLHEIFSNIEQQKDIDPKVFFSVAREMLEVFYKTMRRKAGNEEDAYGKYAVIYQQIENCNSIDSIQKCLNQIFINAKNYFEGIKLNNNTKPVEIIKTYISNHYSEEINLKDISEIVYLNPKYLGDLFKKETGVNYSEYIINYRMDIAKDLLKDVRNRVGEVSEMVGYQDTRHFSKIFKKYVGVTPMQYKKMFG